MLDRSSDSQNNLRVKTVTKDLCSQNNQLYLCDGILSRRYTPISRTAILDRGPHQNEAGRASWTTCLFSQYG